MGKASEYASVPGTRTQHKQDQKIRIKIQKKICRSTLLLTQYQSDRKHKVHWRRKVQMYLILTVRLDIK